MEMPKAICDSVGRETFVPEAHINRTARDDGSFPRLISGEVKVAVCIRMLAGGSYLDLVPLFNVSTCHLYRIFDTFLDWILATMEFPLVQWLRTRNWKAIKALANHFAEKGNGVFYCPFGAIDGLALCIKSPTLKEVAHPDNYYCRKLL